MHSECGSDLLQLFQQISKWRFNFFQLFVAPRQTNKLFSISGNAWELFVSPTSLVELDLLTDLTREFWIGEITFYSVTWLQQSPQNSDVCWSTPGVAASWTPVVVDEEAASYAVGTVMPPADIKKLQH